MEELLESVYFTVAVDLMESLEVLREELLEGIYFTVTVDLMELLEKQILKIVGLESSCLIFSKVNSTPL